MKCKDNLGAEDPAEPVAIVDIVVIEVGAGVVASYPRVIVVILLGKPLQVLYDLNFSEN